MIIDTQMCMMKVCDKLLLLVLLSASPAVFSLSMPYASVVGSIIRGPELIQIIPIDREANVIDPPGFFFFSLHMFSKYYVYIYVFDIRTLTIYGTSLVYVFDISVRFLRID